MVRRLTKLLTMLQLGFITVAALRPCQGTAAIAFESFEDYAVGTDIVDIAKSAGSHLCPATNQFDYSACVESPGVRVSPCGFPGTVQSYGKTSLSIKTRFEKGGIKFTALPVDAGGLAQGVAQMAGSVLYYDAMVLPTLLDETLQDVPSDPLPTANATQTAKLHLIVSRRGLVMSVDGSIAVYPLELGDDEPYTTNWCVCAGYRTGGGMAVTNFMLQAADGGVLSEATSDWHRLTLGRKIVGEGTDAAVVFEVYIDGVRAAAEDGTTDFLALATKPTDESCFMRFVGMGRVDNLEISTEPRDFSPSPELHTISFSTAHGGPVEEIVRRRGEEYGELPRLTEMGWRFVGWCLEPRGGTPVKSVDEVLEDVTLYARWLKTTVVDGCEWCYDVLETGTAMLIPCNASVALTVPSELDGHAVRNIPDLCFAHSSNLVSVVIPPSVTNIGNYAFYDCPNLRSVSFSEGLCSIGSGAFADCTGLGEIVLPQTLKVLGQEVAVRDENVYTVEGSHYEFVTNYMIVTTNGESVTTVARDESSFSSSSSIRSVGKGVFEGCSSLTNIVMQEGLRTIGAGAFFNCRKLQSLVVPDSVLRIGGYAESCQSSESDSFVSMSVMDRLEQQGKASTVTSDNHFSSESKAWCLSVEAHGFCEKCTLLSSVSLPSGLHYLGAHAFSGCERLKSVSLPDGLTTIMEGTFSGCRRMADVHLPANLELVGGVEWFPSESSSHSNVCDALAQNGGTWSVLTGESHVQRSVKDGKVVMLDSLSLNGGMPSVLSNAVDLVELDTRWKPDCSEWICPVDTNCEQWLYTTPVINCIKTLGSCLKDEDWDRMRRMRSALHPSCADYSPMNDGNSRQRWAGAFEGCYSLRKMVLPKSVRRIAPYSFYDCVNLTSIVIPDGIQALGYDAFGGETSLMDIQTTWLNYGDLYEVFPSHAFVTNLVLTSSPKRIDDCEDVYRWINGMYAAGLCVTDQEIDDVITSLVTEHWVSSGPVLAGFRRLRSLTLPEGLERFDQSIGWYEAESLQRVLFPQSLRALGRHAFQECPLKEVVLPANLDAVGDYAFALSDILRVTFQGNAPSDVSPDLFVGEDDWGYYDMADENLQVCVYPGTTGWDGWQETGGLPDDGLWPTEASVFKRRGIRYVDQPLATIVGGTGVEDVYSFYDADKQHVVSVPQSWLSDHGLLGVTSSGGAALLTLSPISTRTIYQSYAAGLDPTDVTDEFRATIEIVDGEAKVSWSPKLSAGEELLRTYTTYGCRDIGGVWVDMDAVPAAEKTDYKFFKVTVEMK